MMSLCNRSSKNLKAQFLRWEELELESIPLTLSDKAKGSGEFKDLLPRRKLLPEFIPLATEEIGQGGGRNQHGVLQNTQEKLSVLEQEAYEKGFEQGEKDGFELGEKKANKLIDNIGKLLTELSRVKENIIKQYERELLDLIVAVADKIVGYRIMSDEGVVRASIYKALSLAGQKNEIKVRVNPEDYDYVEKLRPEFFTEFNEIKSMVITSDPAVSRGGCVVETHSGNVDAAIETQMEMIRQALDSAWGEGKDE